MTTGEAPQWAQEGRGRKDPVELVARELRKSITLRMLVSLAVRPATFQGTLEEASAVLAEAILPALGKHGFLSDSYYDYRREQQKDET